MKVSVIIVNYNVEYFLEQCILSVQNALNGIEGDIWVVDNASVDGSLAMLADKFPSVKVIANTDNVGFSVANNQAIEKSSAEYVLLLNPDTVIEEDTITKSIAFMDDHPKSGALGVRMVDGKGNFLPESKRGLPTPEVALYKMFGLNKIFPNSKRFGKYHLSYLSENETNEVDVLAGAFMMIRKKALDEVGLLDETFFMYGEDIDLSYRIQLGGYKNYYFPETTIIHYKGESTKKQSVNYVFVFYRAMIIFAKKHYSGGLQKGLTFLIKMAIYVRVAMALLGRFFNRFKWVFADIAIMFLMLYLLKDYWEEHITHKEYPRNLMTLHFPYYIGVWVASLYLNGAYREAYNLKRLIRGLGLGLIVIIAIYGLLPNELRHSRGIILFGTLAIMVSLTAYRLIVHFLKYKHLSLNKSQSQKTVIVGNQNERERAFGLLQQSESDQEFIGYVDISAKSKEGKVIGHMGQIQELIQIYKVQQIIFCGEDLSATDIIKYMHDIGPQLNYKIVPSKSSYIIGSNSKNTVGEYYTEQVAIKLADQNNLRQKRAFDIFSSVGLLILMPLLVWFKPFSFWGDVWNVLKGRNTWIGYGGKCTLSYLPKLREGIYTPQIGLTQFTNDELLQDMNIQYAKNFNLYTELNLLVQGIRHKKS